VDLGVFVRARRSFGSFVASLLIPLTDSLVGGAAEVASLSEMSCSELLEFHSALLVPAWPCSASFFGDACLDCVFGGFTRLS